MRISGNVKKVCIIVFIAIILLIGSFYIISIIFNNNVEVNGYYYEQIGKNVTRQKNYYFEEDGTCLITNKSIKSSSSIINISEDYKYCTYKISNSKLRIDIYDTSLYNKKINSESYSIKKIEDGILINNIEYKKKDVDNHEEYILEQLARECAANVARKYGIFKSCTTWRKESDGFYNYSCGTNIRTFIDENSISYDMYNSSSGFTQRNYCYKIVRDKEIISNISNEIITKKIPISIILTGNMSDNYKIESIKSNIDEISITDYNYRVNNLKKYPIYVNVEKLNSNKEYKVKIKKSEYLKSIDIDEIEVSITVGAKKTKEIELSGNEISVNNVGQGLRISATESLKPLKITIFGTEKTLNELENIKPYIDLSDYKAPGIYDIKLKLDLDETIYDYTISPQTVKIKVTS